MTGLRRGRTLGVSYRRASAAAGAAVVAVALLTAAAPAPAGQPPSSEVTELVSRRSNGDAYQRGSTRPSISALGDRIGFSVLDTIQFTFGEFPIFFDADLGIVRDRIAPQTFATGAPIADVVSLSDNGCVMASTQRADDASVSYAVHDVCTSDAWTVPSPNFYSAAPMPGISADGSTAAFPVFSEARLFSRASGYQSFQTVDAPSTSWNLFDIALSDNADWVAAIGRVIFIEFAPSPAAQQPQGGALLVGSAASGTLAQVPTTGDAHLPSWDGSGTLLAYSDDDGAKIYDRTTGQSTLIVPGAREANLSRDGRHLAYTVPDTDTHVFVVTRLGSSWAPPRETQWMSSGSGVVDDLESDTPVISEHGRWVSWSTSDAAFLGVSGGPTNGAHSVVVRERRPVLSVGGHNFGTVTESAEADVAITNTGPSGWRVTSVIVEAPFTLVSQSCPAVLHPGQSCQARVRFPANAVGTSTGAVVVRDDSYPGIPVQASGALEGTVPAPPTLPDLGLALDPNPVDFGGAVVNQPAPGRSATLRNTGSAGLTVAGVTIGGLNQEDFSMVADNCTGVILGAGSTCQIDLGFTPGSAGARFATLSATGSGGTSASTSLIGTGQTPETTLGTTTTTTELIRFFPTLNVSPSSTPTGYVVAVTGVDYPPLDTVQISLGGADPLSVSTDAAGAFELQWLILEGVAQGNYPIDDLATATYDASPVELLVVSSPVRPQGVPLGTRVVRRHVSR